MPMGRWRATAYCVLAACTFALLRAFWSFQRHVAASSGRTRHSKTISRAGRLVQLEGVRTRYWNRTSAKMLVLGQKSSRDFGVYLWAFAVHGFRILAPPAGVFWLNGGTENEPSMLGIGGLLCHSLFLSNCVRQSPATSGSAAQGEQGEIFSHLRGLKINRVAGVRQVLSTKDGLCNTLRASGLSADAIWHFSFPCWVLPQDASLLARQLASQSRQLAESAAYAAATTPTRTDGPGWIVKPARGSHGLGIRVINSSQELAARMLAPSFLRALRTPIIVNPYLRDPLLHHGRKWDVRTYVLATSVLPMRLYLFSEGIVRYAAASTYSRTSTDDSTVLTNTWVGQKLLQRGVGSITGSIADLCKASPTSSRAGGGEGGHEDDDDEEVQRCTSEMIDTMRDAIGRIFLAAEPRLRDFYSVQYAKAGRSGAGASGDDEGEQAREMGGDTSFRCAECYHFFGVDLIADAQRRMHVIEVNVSPDLSLSTQGPACHHAASNCSDGSTAYDHTKLAAAYNTVHLVYSREAAAAQLQRLIEQHAAEISRLDLLISPSSPPAPGPSRLGLPPSPGRNGSGMPSPASGSPTLHKDVAEYLLDVLRERHGAGCFAPVYPSMRYHDAHGKYLDMLASSKLRTCVDARRNDSGDGYPPPKATPECSSVRRRLQMHTLLGIVMRELTRQDAEDSAGAGGAGFRRRCEQMLRDVPSTDAKGAWGQRSHIFEEIVDLAS